MSAPQARIGITMREANAVEYHEPRDAIARDWPHFLDIALPQAQWLPVPNIGPAAVTFATVWALEAFVLTGGADPGTSPARDATELALIEHALSAGAPVLGVCRGMQLLNRHFEGTLTPVAGHVASNHPVECTALGEARFGASQFHVNSYHRLGVSEADLAPVFRPLAHDQDGFIEAMEHIELPVLAIMWHPERHGPESGLAASRALFATWLSSRRGAI